MRQFIVRLFRQLNFIFFLVLLNSSCEKLLHTEEFSIGKIESYEHLITASQGVYGCFNDLMNYEGTYRPNLNGDDLSHQHQGLFSYYGKSCSQNSYFDPGTDQVWQKAFKTIASINNILNQFNADEEQNERITNILGELYLIRGYCYFRLTRTFGQIPLISNININFNLEKSSFEAIYHFIESDLKMAMNLLPESNFSARIPYVTPHRGTAKAILAEVYLNWAGYPCNNYQKYELSAKEAGETIDRAGFFGFNLVEDFSLLWDSSNQDIDEGVFCVYLPEYVWFFKNSSQLGSNHFSYLYYGMGEKYSCNLFSTKAPFLLGPNSLDISINYFSSELNFFNNYPSSYRKGITFFTTIYVPPEFKTSRPELDTGYININTLDKCDRVGYRKFYFNPVTIDFKDLDNTFPIFGLYYIYDGNLKIYLFRYAQTLLTYAEATARSGQLNSKAYECLNQVRRRAHHLDLYTPSNFDLQPGLSPETFTDSVIWERAWELCGEPEGRWFDLVRLEMVEELPDLRYKQEGGPPDIFDKSVYFFPIPAKDTLLNPGLGNL
jgi:hypothetical protein